MSEFTVIDTRTGEVLRTGTCPDGMVEAQASALWEAASPGRKNHETQWHDGSKWAAKKAIRPKVKGTTVSGLPIPCTCFVESQSYEIDDGVADFEFGQPGVYMVRIVARGHKTISIEVQA